MTKDKLVGLLHSAYRFGRDNGMGRSDKNFNDFLEKSKIKEELSKLHQPAVISAVCPECGCNKLQNDGGNYRSCLNILCDWKGQTDL